MKGKYFWGIILIIIGAALLLDQFEIISFGQIFKLYWPSLLILAGLINLFSKKSSKWENIILIIVGLALQINRLDLLKFNAFKLVWPILLILIGLKIMLSKNSPIIDIRINSDSKKEE